MTSMRDGGLEYVMWNGTLRTHGFKEQVLATAAGGFDVLTLPYVKYVAETATGASAKDLLSFAADNGVTVDFLDGITSWTPVRYPIGEFDLIRQAMDFSANEAFELCDAMGLTRIVAIAGFAREGDLPHSQLVDCFGRFCETAAQAGIWVDLEFVPMLGISTLQNAWSIVRDADCENSGVLIDTWHFARGGSTASTLESIPPGRIVNVQLAEGAAQPVGDDLINDCVHHRALPGRGELDLTELFEKLADRQDVRSIGPEIFSDAIDRLAAPDAGRSAGEATRDCAERIWPRA